MKTGATIEMSAVGIFSGDDADPVGATKALQAAGYKVIQLPPGVPLADANDWFVTVIGQADDDSEESICKFWDAVAGILYDFGADTDEVGPVDPAYPPFHWLSL